MPFFRVDRAIPVTIGEPTPARENGAPPATLERSAHRSPRDVAAESAGRARRKVVRLARYNRLVNMWTATFPGEGIHDYETAYQLIAGFIHDKGDWFRERGYEAVPELHPGGHGWHWHVLFNGPRMPRNVLMGLQRRWTAYVRAHAEIPGWEGQGLVRHHVKRWASERVAGRYAGKYVAKSVGEGLCSGRHRYLRGEGLALPEASTSLHLSWLDALAAVPRIPLAWTVFYDGRPDSPFLWLSCDPPPY